MPVRSGMKRMSTRSSANAWTISPTRSASDSGSTIQISPTWARRTYSTNSARSRCTAGSSGPIGDEPDMSKIAAIWNDRPVCRASRPTSVRQRSRCPTSATGLRRACRAAAKTPRHHRAACDTTSATADSANQPASQPSATGNCRSCAMTEIAPTHNATARQAGASHTRRHDRRRSGSPYTPTSGNRTSAHAIETAISTASDPADGEPPSQLLAAHAVTTSNTASSNLNREAVPRTAGVYLVWLNEGITLGDHPSRSIGDGTAVHLHAMHATPARIESRTDDRFHVLFSNANLNRLTWTFNQTSRIVKFRTWLTWPNNFNETDALCLPQAHRLSKRCKT
ncbi:hypothetical protein EMIT0111MI5_180026 [Burkholderia sp. IT-111MI5]